MSATPIPTLQQPPDCRGGSQALVETLRIGFAVLRALMVVSLGMYVLSGIFVVRPDEAAMIMRFGAVVSGDEGPLITSGRWHWAWPQPVDRIIRIPTKTTQTLHTDYFWGRNQGHSPAPPGKTLPVDAGGQSLKPGADGYLVTGDRNIVHAQWSLTYHITDPLQFLTAAVSAEEMIRNGFHQIILRTVAQTPISDLLYAGAEPLRLRVQEAAAKRIGAMPLGIAVDHVGYLQREPPRSTTAAFHQLAEADQGANETINKAKGYAHQRWTEAQGTSARITAEAEAYRERTVAAIRADADYFSTILAEYERSPDTLRMTLQAQTLQQALDTVGAKYIISRTGAKGPRQVRLVLGPEASLPTQD